MTRASTFAALLALALLAGCGDDLESGAFLERPRVLGVRIEVEGDPTRAAPGPGETFTLRWLVASPNNLEWTGAVVGCVPLANQTGMPMCSGAPFAITQSEPSTEPTVTMTVPERAAFDGTTGQILLLGVFCAEGTPTMDVNCTESSLEEEVVIFSFDAFLDGEPNLHPSLSDETFTYAGDPWESPMDPLPESGCRMTEASPSLPHVTWRGEDEEPVITISTQPEDREPFLELVIQDEAEPVPVESREELTITHIVTAGRFVRPQTVIFDDESLVAEVPWEHPAQEDIPPDGMTVEMFFVLRDGRGGMDWTRRAVCLLP